MLGRKVLISWDGKSEVDVLKCCFPCGLITPDLLGEAVCSRQGGTKGGAKRVKGVGLGQGVWLQQAAELLFQVTF